MNDSAPYSIAANRLLSTEEIRNGRARLESRPQSVSIDLTGQCNMVPSCVFCFKGASGQLYPPTPLKRINRVLDFARSSERVRDCSLGEPLTYPDLDSVLARVCSNHQFFSFSTNGLLLTPRRIEMLRPYAGYLDMSVSVNAATPETYYHLHGRDLGHTLDNVERMISRCCNPERINSAIVDLSMVVMRANRGEVEDFIRMAHGLGANSVTLRALGGADGRSPRTDFGYYFDFHRERLSEAEYGVIAEGAAEVAASLGQPLHVHWEQGLCETKHYSDHKQAEPCLMPWKYLFPEDHSGKAYGCVYLEAPVGRLAEQSLEEIWNGPVMVEMRQSLLRGEVPRICWLHGNSCPLVAAARRADEGSHYFDGEQLDTLVVMGENEEPHLGLGWYALELVPDPARWTRRTASLFLPMCIDGRLHVEATTFLPEKVEERARGSVTINGTTVGHFALEYGVWSELQYEVPPSCGQQTLKVSLTVDRPWIPARVGAGADYRELGILVRKVWIE